MDRGEVNAGGLQPGRTLRTGRLVMTPVGWGDLEALRRLKADPLVYAQMLGGVRGEAVVAAELAEDTAFWARVGVGMWMVRVEAGVSAVGNAAVGLAGVHERADGRGLALRFAFTPESRGRGLAREAAGAALRFAHERAGLARVVAVARESNIGSRTVLGAIGMRDCETFVRGGEAMVMYESLGRST